MTWRPMLHKKNPMQLKAWFGSSDVPAETPPIAEESKISEEVTLPTAEENKTSDDMQTDAPQKESNVA